MTRAAGQLAGEHVLHRAWPHPIIEITHDDGRQLGQLASSSHLPALPVPFDELEAEVRREDKEMPAGASMVR